MIIQYILNLQKGRSYTGSGSFELIGNALTQEALTYAASGIFELFGSATAFIGTTPYTGSGSFQLFGSSNIIIPQNLATIKFSINDYGYSTSNDQYQVKQINSDPNNPIYVASRLGNNYNFTNQTLLTVPEIQAYNNVQYKKQADLLKEKISIITNKINSLTPPVETSYNTQIAFTVKEYLKDSLLDSKQIEAVMGSADAIMYKTNDGIFSQNEVYNPATAQTQYQNKIDALLQSYNKKIDQITNKINNTNPIVQTDSLLAIKFQTNQYGKNVEAFNQKVIQIYGINDSLVYQTAQAAVPQNLFLTPPEEQTRARKDYGDKITYYNQKIAQINNRINNY